MQRDLTGLTRAEAFAAAEDRGSNPTDGATLGDVINARFGRRGFLKGSLGVTAAAALLGTSALVAPRPARAAAAAHMGFEEIAHGVDETHHVAKGYSADILIRWGDPVLKDAPAFDPLQQTAAAQARQFGYNNDFIGYLPIEGSAEHGLLFINHEYTAEEVMFPGLGGEQDKDFSKLTYEQVEIELAAHGASVIEVKKENGKWAVVADSQYARRITGGGTYCQVTGPAAGHDLLKTSADPTGTLVLGTLNNCAGGMTPWGTVLTAEENFNGYFWGQATDGHPYAKAFKRYGVPAGWYGWARFHDRFDVNREPNEPNRFGWLVEVDPMDPRSLPKKRTALGRFKHEGASIVVNKDGRVVVYSGDDERFDYVYRFVSAGTYDAARGLANGELLDEGTLSVARFDADGSVEWLPLVQGQGKLTAENGFPDQATVLVNARLAADAVGATRMDRPEDVDTDVATGRIYVMLTNNSRRKADQVDGPNPRAENAFGQVLELTAPDLDHTADRFTWELLAVCGDPAKAEVGARWNPATSENGWFASPDNCALDAAGNLWITTDQGEAWAKSGTADGVWAMGTAGESRGLGKMFFRVPIGAEMCGPCFTPDGRTLFVAVQHPATDGAKDWDKFGRTSTFEDPATRWPDFQPDMPPRPSIVVITKDDGGVIGS